MGRLGKDWKVARRCSHVLASATDRVGVTATNASLLSVACERALERDARHPRGAARRGAGPAPVQVPDGDEEVGALADGVAAGRAAQAGRQHVVRERAPDQDRRLRVQPQRLGQRRAQVGQPADVVQRCARIT